MDMAASEQTMDESEQIPNARPKRVLVIGGGASGLVALRNLRERGDFDEVQLVERRDDVGGVWYLDDETKPGPRWPSPAYPGLIGNVLPEFLSFSAFPAFPDPPSTAAEQPFPSLTETHAYLRAFAAPLRAAGAIRLGVEVRSVEELPARTGWRVRMRRWGADGDGGAAEPEELEETWDAVVLAVAFYDHPVFPSTPGIALLHEHRLARHAQTWRGPRGYEGKRVLVIGNANSSNDICAQLAPRARAVYQSVRRPNFPGFPSLPDARIQRVAPVAEYTVRAREDGDGADGEDGEERGSAHVADARLADGRVLRGLDVVLFGTGYRPIPDFVRVRAPPFAPSPPPSPSPSTPSSSPPTSAAPALVPLTAPTRVPSLFRYTLYAPNPALALVGTAFAAYTPFTLADVCSTWLALAWAGAVAYPTALPELLAFERERMDAVAAARSAAPTAEGEPSALVSYAVLDTYEAPFAALLRSECVRARPELGGVLPVWSAERTEVRRAMYAVKRRALEVAREREGGGGGGVDE
ncbi:hypothetical protein FB451DRAFT_1126537 [Mycena latifolia]|nr:hypothetical protein FB451DRAFT_1126537 [Mycena latifolia]